MATATLILLILGAGSAGILAFGADDGGRRVGMAISAIWHGGSAWWVYFNSGLFG